MLARKISKRDCIVLWRTKCRSCTIFHHFTRGSFRRPFRRILNFSIFRRKQSALELFDIIFEKGSSKGPLGKNKMNNEILQLSRDSLFLQSVALKSIITTREATLHCSFYYGCHLHMLYLRCSLVVFCLLHFVMFLTLFVLYSFPTVCFEILEVLRRIVIT